MAKGGYPGLFLGGAMLWMGIFLRPSLVSRAEVLQVYLLGQQYQQLQENGLKQIFPPQTS